MKRLAAFAALALSLIAAAAVAAMPAPSSAPQTTVTAIEAEVMCPICGTLLELAESPQAKREKVFIAKLVAEGKAKAEIKDALVAQYGPSVLALPKAKGFDLSAYLVPVLALIVAIVALAFSVARWRRAGGPRSKPREPNDSQPSDDDAARLEADLSRYDL
ncbi:MAG: cytochrome c-type biogenesis protein [Solirubrobacterales bacterium]